uniref:Uncharacterized protein n=1 Tax=Picea glauca TaxID=3330 RepID=A0A101LZF3_PICGL|nr:hypothetical protein ABT39_MTgene5039 [Picea glauca]
MPDEFHDSPTITSEACLTNMRHTHMPGLDRETIPMHTCLMKPHPLHLMLGLSHHACMR